MVIGELSVDQNIEKRDGSDLIPFSDVLKLACEEGFLKKMRNWTLMGVVVVSREREERNGKEFLISCLSLGHNVLHVILLV
jgi:hypothetical protein